MTTTRAFPTYSIKGRQVEYKSFPFQMKSFDEDQGTITGYLSTFGNVDLQKDCVVKGAFKKTLTEAYARKLGGRAYLFALLWMHDSEQPIGGVLDAQENAEGLLITAQLDISVNAAGIPNNPIATKVFSGFKMGYIDELSMGYLAIQKDYEAGIRYLKEVALLEGSAITMLMAANPEALVPASGVKQMTTILRKGVSGSTTLPLAKRDAAWDGSAAHNRVVEWATGDDDEIDPDKMKQAHFWFDESAPENIGSYKLIFADIIDGKLTAVPKGIFGCAGALQGARGTGVDIPSEDETAVKARIATWYSKMAKAFDDDGITPPWEDDGKGGRRAHSRKNFTDVHNAGRAADCMEDWCDLLNDLTTTMFQIFGMSDTPDTDMSECLSQFGDALMKEWTPKAVDANLGQYLNDCGYCNPQSSVYVPFAMQTGSDYGWMARSGRASHKAGRTISAATREKLEQHQAEMKELFAQHTTASDQLASQFKSMVKDHITAMEQKVSDLTNLWADEGQGPAYGNDDPPDGSNNNPSDDNGKSRFARREPASTAQPLPRPRTTQPPRTKARDTASEMTLADLGALLS